VTAADELAAAAQKLRALAMGAPANNQPWRYAKGLPSDSVRTASGWEVAYGDTPGDLRYIAAVHPGVGLLLADWLASWDGADISEHAAMPDDLRHALLIARALNAGGQP
jgi:hypothetical protein